MNYNNMFLLLIPFVSVIALMVVYPFGKIEITAKAIDAAITDTKNPELIAQQSNQQYRNLVEQTLMRKAVAELLLKL